MLKKIVLSVKSDDRIFRVIKTGFFSISIRAFSMVLSFISVPMTLNYLGDERYGIWLTITSLISVLTFADFGLGVSLINSISKAYAKDSIIDAKKEISNVFYILLFICFVGLILYSLLYEKIFFFKSSSISSFAILLETKQTVAVFVLITLMNLPLGIIQRIFEGYQNGFIFQIFLFFGTLFGFIVLFIFIKLEYSLPYLAIALLLPNFLSSILAGIYLFLFKSKKLLPSFRLFNFRHSIKSLKVGLVFFLLQIFQQLRTLIIYPRKFIRK
jgi:O-antigen/teichoic acid export membrane protein